LSRKYYCEYICADADSWDLLAVDTYSATVDTPTAPFPYILSWKCKHQQLIRNMTCKSELKVCEYSCLERL